MALTADRVVVELQAQTEAYDAKIANSAKQFEARVQSMAAAAAQAGDSSSTAFEGASNALERMGKNGVAAGQGLKTVGSEGRMAQQQMRNLAFQFQDIGTMMAAGQSPFALLAQQLPQVVMYGGQLGGVMGALKSTVAGLLSPLGLATTAFVLLGSTAISYFADTSKSGGSLNDILEAHRKHLEDIIDGYRRAQDAAKGYREEALRLSPREAQIETETTQKGLRSRYTEEVDRLRRVLQELQKWASGQGLTQLSEQIGTMREEAGKTEPRMQTILEGLKSIKLEGFNVPGLEAFITTAIDAAENIRKIGAEIGATSEAARYLDEINDIWARMAAAVDKIDSSKARKEVQDLTDKFEQGEISLEDLVSALGKLSSTNVDLQGQISEVIRLGTAADLVRQKLEALSGPIGGTNTVAGGKTDRLSNLPDVVDITPTRRVDPYFDDPIKKSRGGGSKRENDYARLTKQIEARTKALEAETNAQAGLNPLVDDYGYAAEKAKLEAQLLVAAENAKIAITPSLREAIGKTAEGYAQAAAAAHQLDEQQENVRRTAEELRDLGKDVMGGFIQDLRDGKSGAEALAGALQKVADKLLDMALNSLFSKGGIFGGGMGLLGGAIIPGILHDGGVAGRDGYGHGRSVSPAVFGGAKRYHSGGIAGLRPGEVPAILQRGETVIPKGGFGGGGGQQQRQEITIHLVGEEGELFTPRVTQISGQTAGVVVKQSRPLLARDAVSSVQAASRNRPGLFR